MKRSTFWRFTCFFLLTFWLSLMWGLHRAHAEIACPGFVMGFADDGALYSVAPTGKYREYPIIKQNGLAFIGLTQYGRVSVSFDDPATVVWTNYAGDIVIQNCGPLVE